MTALSDDDLAYMRETQAETRPTPATLYAVTSQNDGMGGRTQFPEPGDGIPIQVRLTRINDGTSGGAIPLALAEHYSATDLVKFHTDLVPVVIGNLIACHGQVYTVVANGYVDDWTTAQTVWATQQTGRG